MNLKGYMVGNGLADLHYDVSPSFPATVYNFNLIKEDLFEQFTDPESDCFFSFNGAIPYNNSAECKAMWTKIETLTGDLNWYDLYRWNYDLANATNMWTDAERMQEVTINGTKKTYKRGMTMQEYTPWMKPRTLKSPLLFDYVTDYVNREDVRTAMHIPVAYPAWNQCGT